MSQRARGAVLATPLCWRKAAERVPVERCTCAGKPCMHKLRYYPWIQAPTALKVLEHTFRGSGGTTGSRTCPIIRPFGFSYPRAENIKQRKDPLFALKKKTTQILKEQEYAGGAGTYGNAQRLLPPPPPAAPPPPPPLQRLSPGVQQGQLGLRNPSTQPRAPFRAEPTLL